MDEESVIPNRSHFCRPWTYDGLNRIKDWRDRCQVAVNYYYIDFGLSDLYPNGSQNALAVGTSGQIKTVPELSNQVPYNPFKVDIYQLGYTFLTVIEVSDPPCTRFSLQC